MSRVHLFLPILLWALAVSGCSDPEKKDDAPPASAPTVRFVAPDQGAFVAGDVELLVDLEGGDAVTFQVDDVEIGSVPSAPFSISWDSTTVPDGAHTLMATSGQGTATGSDSNIVTVDNTPPEVEILELEDGQPVTAGVLIVRATATDANGILSSTLTVNGAVAEDAGEGGLAFRVPIVEETLTYTLKLEVLDLARNVATDEVTVGVNAAPKVTVQNCTIEPCAVFEASEPVVGELVVGAVVEDDDRIVAVRFLVDGVVVAEDDTEPWRFPWDSSTVRDGERELTVVAVDAGGVEGSGTAVVRAANCDTDGDGFARRSPVCQGTDCDDGAGEIFPGADDPDGDGTDSNCDGEDGIAQGPEVDCGPLPAFETACAATPGASGLLVRGDVLVGNRVFRQGEVLIDSDGVIQCAGCSCESRAGRSSATVVSCADSVISPGFVNPHDHLGWTHNQPGDWGDERFEHRNDWREGLRGHDRLSRRAGASDEEQAWGEFRHLLGGTTSIVASGGVPGVLRNIDDDGLSESLGVVAPSLDTFPLGDNDGHYRDDSCDYPRLPATFVTELNAWAPHVSEGIDDEARNEFLCISDAMRGVDVVDDNAALIHGVALNGTDGRGIAADGAAVVWSPRSNVSLYGHTAPIPMLVDQGVLIAMGTDWMPSGSAHLGRELACARELNERNYGGALSALQLWRMATVNGAAAIGAEHRVGALRRGLVADIQVVDRHGEADAHEAVISAASEDIRLVLRGGVPLYGDASVFEAQPAWQDGCEDMGSVCGEARWICAEREVGISLDALSSAARGSVGIFFCGEPEGEPSCLPFRPGEFDGVPEQGDRDGDGILDRDDNCPDVFNAIRPMDGDAQADVDGDGAGDLCDPCPDEPGDDCSPPDPEDVDADGLALGADNCPETPNADQADADDDGRGDACDPCPDHSNLGNAGCPVTIPTIKMRGVREGEAVIVEGVVTAGVRRRFFLQVPEAQWPGGPEFTGLHVYVPSENPLGLPAVRAGDHVRLHGSVSSFFGQIQVTGVTQIEQLGTAPIPTPQVVAPSQIATGGPLADAFEGVLVTTSGSVTAHNPPAGPGDDDPSGEFVLDGSLRVGDYLFDVQLPPIAREVQVTGVLRFDAADSKVEPRSTADIVTVELPPRLVQFGPGEVVVDATGELSDTFPPLELRLSRPAEEGGAAVVLTSSDPGVVAVADVSLNEGEISMRVRVRASAASEEPVTITARLGDNSFTALVTALDPDRNAVPVALEAGGAVRAGRATTFTVVLDQPAQAGGALVTVSADPGTAVSVPDSVRVPELATRVEFAVDGLTEGTETITARVGQVQVTAEVEVQPGRVLGLILSEVLYDTDGQDDQLEWVEIYNGSGDIVDLAGYSLGNGGQDYTWSRVQLQGLLAPGDCFVVGGPTSNSTNGNPDFDQAIRFNPNFQNSGGTADAVALFDVTAREFDANTVPIDAVIYGGTNGNGLMDSEGDTPEPHVRDSGSGNTIERAADGWRVQQSPTPGDCTALD